MHHAVLVLYFVGVALLVPYATVSLIERGGNPSPRLLHIGTVAALIAALFLYVGVRAW